MDDSNYKLVMSLVGTTLVSADEFFESLGRFVAAFADLEVQIQTVLWKFTGLSRPMAPAVFSGVRTDAAMSLLKRLAEATKWADEKRLELDNLALQLGEINQLRNDILHFGAQYEKSETWLVTNRLFAHVENRVRETRITVSTLDNATRDIEKMERHFLLLGWEDELPDSVKNDFHEARKRPWLYKSPTLAGHQKKTHGGRSKRQRRPRPSPA